MLRGAIVLLSLLASGQGDKAHPGPGIDAPRKYVPFPIDGNPEQKLADFLRTKDGQDFLKGQIRNVLENPQQFEDLVKKFGSGSPFGESLKKLAKDHQGVPLDLANLNIDKFIEENVGRAPVDFDKMLKALQAMKGVDGPQLAELAEKLKNLDLSPDSNLSKLGDLVDDEPPWDERLSEWLVDFLKRDDVREDLLQLFENAPDLQEAVSGLLDSLQGAGGAGDWAPKFPDLKPGKWNLDVKPPELPFKLDGLPKLPAISMPQLPRLNLPMPRLGQLRMPRNPFGGGPEFGRPSVSGNVEWLYVIAAVALIGLTWWLLRKVRWTRSEVSNGLEAFLASLPASITTRTQLRQAFDAFALARLGKQAMPWNHRHVARQLGAAADTFANLYEVARYTPGDDRLTPAEQAAVRDSLAVLTGGAK